MALDQLIESNFYRYWQQRFPQSKFVAITQHNSDGYCSDFERNAEQFYKPTRFARHSWDSDTKAERQCKYFGLRNTHRN